MHSAAIAGTRFVSCAKTNKDIFKIFFTVLGSQAILVFRYGWRYSNGTPVSGGPVNRGVECKGGMKKLTIFDQYLAVSRKRL